LEEVNHEEQSYSAELVGGFELLPSVEKATSMFFQLLAGIPRLRENNHHRAGAQTRLICRLHWGQPIRFDSPRLTWSDTSSKSARPAKDFESCETVSIAESAQCPLVRCPAQLPAAKE
jgi:hypothetical protein